jgi:hypothetical protein
MTGCLVEQASYVGASYVGIRDKLFRYLDFGAVFLGAMSAGREVFLSYVRVVPCSLDPPARRGDGNQGRTQRANSPTHPAR